VSVIPVRVLTFTLLSATFLHLAGQVVPNHDVPNLTDSAHASTYPSGLRLFTILNQTLISDVP
jgi:hypothetical protein